MIGWGIHFQISGLGSQVPGTGPQVRVQVQDLNFPVPEPVPDNPHLRPEGRDLGPEDASCLKVGLTTPGQPRLSEGAQPYPL